MYCQSLITDHLNPPAPPSGERALPSHGDGGLPGQRHAGEVLDPLLLRHVLRGQLLREGHGLQDPLHHPLPLQPRALSGEVM